MKENQTLHIYFLICILLILTGTSCNDSGVKRRILVIHSYEAEYAGYKHNGEKIRQQFHRQKIHADIRTFYLDCDSYREKDELNRMYNFLDTTANWKPEIVLVYDDQATYSLMACEHPLVKQTPVVFAGVNYPNRKLLKQYPNVTGFWDKPEFMKTVELIETLFGPMRIHFWLDNTYLGRQTMEQFISEIGPLRMKEYAPSLNVINENGFFTYKEIPFNIITNYSQTAAYCRQSQHIQFSILSIQGKPVPIIYCGSYPASTGIRSSYRASVISHPNASACLPAALPLPL
ncbi:MAG: hypothetical protein LUH63_19365 [Parabacteroides sp.]|nr:hypothetical protein [Parabacteroides sp.]